MAASINFGASHKHFARSFRAKSSILEISGSTNLALGAPRKEDENPTGFYTATGFPVEAHHVLAFKREDGQPGFKQKPPQDMPVETICLAPGYSLFSSTYPQAPGPIPESRPQPRVEKKSLMYHPLGLTNIADVRRYLPGINSCIEDVATNIQADHYQDDEDFSSLPRHVKVQKTAAVYADLRSALAKVKGQRLQHNAPWAGGRPYTPTPSMKAEMERSLARPNTMSSTRSSHRCRSLRHERSAAPRPATGATRALPPSTMVPEIMDFLASTGFKGMKASASSPSLRGH
eukprot:TRINITY_DN121650_c0_g1_i1.p1 TRINITY_DN121650_c0_g1~~TRINITY_DN121650_c0_g1_i1.p1  ORF type:complete len:289 (+),score=55.72 TRINITY_DN121650_c0_g1_i1:98-964(+)